MYIQRLPLETLDEPFSVTVTTSQRNIGKESGWVYLNTGSRKGKTLSEKTRVTRFDFPAPHTINCRVVRFEIGSSGHYETLLTNLPCDEFPVEEMEKIYSLRWRIEQGFDALKNKTGLDQAVRDFVFSFRQTNDFMEQLEKMLTFLLPLYAEEGKSALVIAIGCTGGHHRSVAVAHELAEYITEEGYQVTENHRDISR